MSNETATLTSLNQTGIRALHGQEQWCLTLVYHPDQKFQGRRVVIEPGHTITLGRDETHFGEGGLYEQRVSRRHARVWVTEGGSARLEDLGSRNGTRVNEETVSSAELEHKDRISVGGIIILLHRAPGVYQSPSDKRLMGSGHGIAEVLGNIDKVARHDTTVLILGETGTGKELVARRVHEKSGRRGNFFAVNCGGVQDTLLQSELFGHVRGAFSGADKDRQGLIEAAHGGTLFLDEIGDASPALQVSLLRFLQEGEVRKIGSNRTIKVDTRIVAATHRDLLHNEGEHEFREDLYARLSRWEIRIPPLRDRLEDVPELVSFFLANFAKTPTQIHRRLAGLLYGYSWPRNVRELEMVCERALIEAGDERPLPLTPALEELLKNKDVHSSTAQERKNVSRPKTREMRDPALLQGLLRKHKGNVRLVSKELNVARNTLYRWFKAFEIDPESYREE